MKIPYSIFLEKCKNIHNDGYEYFEDSYNGMTRLIEIKCKKCNFIFKQYARNHINGGGCPHCNNRIVNTEIFIRKSIKIHGNKYDYSDSIYKNTYSKLNIKCNVCKNIFSQKPNDHLSGHGCPNCKGVKKLNLDEFIQKSKLIHHNNYDYNKSIYINNITPLVIKCNRCNCEFLQKPVHHKNGSDCPYCFRKKYTSKLERKFLNELSITKRQQKIGDFVVDGIKENVIYEFLGDYWHGNPHKYKSNCLNKLANKTFGELYEKTKLRFKYFKDSGYKILYIWENDWKSMGLKGIKEFDTKNTDI